MPMPILDRIPSVPDPIRQTRYAMAPLVAGLLPRSYTWRVPYTLDQGAEGACVAHGIVHEAIARPVPVDFTDHVVPVWAERAIRVLTREFATDPRRVAQAFAFDLYDWCRDHDEWEGSNYDGTSAAAGAKGAVEAGLWDEYRWAQTVEEFAVWVSRNGPGCAAIDWFTGMMQPDKDGYLNASGRVEGGHQILVNGYSVKRAAFRVHNSWGSDWGSDGEAWISMSTMRVLHWSNGELVGPIRRLR
jgi:hypothetical protein